jgi:hypothetical protein
MVESLCKNDIWTNYGGQALKSIQFSRWSDLENLPPFNMIFLVEEEIAFHITTTIENSSKEG